MKFLMGSFVNSADEGWKWESGVYNANFSSLPTTMVVTYAGVTVANGTPTLDVTNNNYYIEVGPYRYTGDQSFPGGAQQANNIVRRTAKGINAGGYP